MQCPNCDGKLESKTFKKVRIDECDKCQGLWFDRDELRRAKDSTDEDLSWLDFNLFEYKENKYTRSQSGRHCPKDSTNLEKLTYPHSKVSIDACSNCKGVWLDRDEFDKIIGYLEDTVVTNTSGDYAKEALREVGEILNGEELKASEFRDLFTVVKLGETRLGVEHEKITAFLTFFPIR